MATVASTSTPTDKPTDDQLLTWFANWTQGMYPGHAFRFAWLLRRSVNRLLCSSDEQGKRLEADSSQARESLLRKDPEFQERWRDSCFISERKQRLLLAAQFRPMCAVAQSGFTSRQHGFHLYGCSEAKPWDGAQGLVTVQDTVDSTDVYVCESHAKCCMGDRCLSGYRCPPTRLKVVRFSGERSKRLLCDSCRCKPMWFSCCSKMFHVILHDTLIMRPSSFASRLQRSTV